MPRGNVVRVFDLVGHVDDNRKTWFTLQFEWVDKGGKGVVVKLDRQHSFTAIELAKLLARGAELLAARVDAQGDELKLVQSFVDTIGSTPEG